MRRSKRRWTRFAVGKCHNLTLTSTAPIPAGYVHLGSQLLLGGQLVENGIIHTLSFRRDWRDQQLTLHSSAALAAQNRMPQLSGATEPSSNSAQRWTPLKPCHITSPVSSDLLTPGSSHQDTAVDLGNVFYESLELDGRPAKRNQTCVPADPTCMHALLFTGSKINI